MLTKNFICDLIMSSTSLLCREENPLVAAQSTTSTSSCFGSADGLNAISELDGTDDWQQKGIIHRSSFMAKDNLTAKRRGLVLVNNDYGAIGQ